MEIVRRKYIITTTKRVFKSFQELPQHIQERLWALLNQLATQGPNAHNWPNYSKLGKNKYHCHLKYGYVACWTFEGESILIEVYYPDIRDKSS